jgi:hypothetical protein
MAKVVKSGKIYYLAKLETFFLFLYNIPIFKPPQTYCIVKNMFFFKGIVSRDGLSTETIGV